MRRDGVRLTEYCQAFGGGLDSKEVAKKGQVVSFPLAGIQEDPKLDPEFFFILGWVRVELCLKNYANREIESIHWCFLS